MPIYKFKVSEASGQLKELLIEGDSQKDATRRLQRRGVIPLDCLGEASVATAGGGGGGISWRSRFDIVDFTDRLVPLLEASIPLERALAILEQGTEKPASAAIIADLRRGLHEGRKFSQLIRDRGNVFPRLYASVVEAGEEAGALPQVMKELRRHLNDSRELRAFLISSSLYPLIILVVSMLLMALLLVVVVPRFATVLLGTGQQLPTLTLALLTISELVRSFWWLPLLMFAALLLLARQARRGGKVQHLLHQALLHLPLCRRLTVQANLARMARTMVILMRSGAHLLDTVAISTRIIQNDLLRDSLSGVIGELRRGQRLSVAMGHSRYVPAFLLRMAAVGEETGEVASMLERVAERYETDLKRLIQRLLSILEPVMILVLGMIVGVVVLAMFLAIMDMQGGV